MTTAAFARTRSLPLDGARALRSAFELASELVAEAHAEGMNFDKALERLERGMGRVKAAFLAQDHAEAEAALRYHAAAKQELEGDFVPLYYKKAVLDNVAARYHKAARTMLATA